jgi:hypothetical protein
MKIGIVPRNFTCRNFILTRRYQQQIRDSLLWDEMVMESGEEEGERILQGSFAFKIR